MPIITVTCHTAGCENAGVPIEVESESTDPATGEVTTVGAFVCGPCGYAITDISPIEEESTT